ncbi:transposase [Chryseobacterium koreense]|uniref:Transposase n=1 Tax=Chryseobacterium koreense CCUG 49689 TaxID=1304281 RepID=A0A0J7IUI3_9FLAO|nr:transposase [Chryseobacterium koreense]KMQ69489.1 transposase [Chryseobacterium koreense CCUG 49689]MBB5334856.1 transposase [Chryseobacterium koreense]
MSQRRKFNSQFKFKVVVEALSERLPFHELAKKYELHPNQITTWKKEFLKNGADIFGKEKALEEKKEDVDKLYKVIGQQKMEIDFLKKALS